MWKCGRREGNRKQTGEYNKSLQKTLQIKMDSGPFRSDSLDEEFFAYQQKTSLSKTVIIESNCHPSHQYSVQIPYNFITRQLDLGQALYGIFQQTIPQGHSYQVFYYCSESEYFVFGGMYPFQDYLYLEQSYVGKPIISVKIIRIHPPIEEEAQIISKKKRINDRTIREVLEKVAEWRSISKTKSITLQQSSKQMNLSKKTLDDYFYQIKQGEYYGFDFDTNQNERIGVLRKFVKENHKKKPEQTIKILEQFMGIQDKEAAVKNDDHQQQQNDSQYSEEEQ